MSTAEKPSGPVQSVGDQLLRRAVVTRFDIEEIVVVPIAAVVIALVLGTLTMMATGVSLPTIGRAFTALFVGAFGSTYALSETLTAAAPLILAGLGIALAFRAGLFNIGAEGQVVLGGVAAVAAGFMLTGLPMYLHLPLALIAGMVAGALWASIAGWLKAATGAHEVITTIMLNLISFRLLDYLLRNPPIQKPGRSDPISETILPTAQLPKLLSWDPTLRVHLGVIIAILAVGFVYWLLFRSSKGFEFRASGANPDAARYAGMRSGLIIVAVMATAGALAGLAGANQVLGVLGRASPGLSANVGFDAIAVALLGRSHPFGVLLAGLLFGALQAGGRQMQVAAGVSIDLIGIIQALVIVFMAAPLLIRTIVPWIFQRQRQGGARP